MSELETEALKRKERLKLLKSKRAIDQEVWCGYSNCSPSHTIYLQNTSAEQGKQPEKPKLKFRSYNPQTESLKETKLPKAKPNAGKNWWYNYKMPPFNIALACEEMESKKFVCEWRDALTLSPSCNKLNSAVRCVANINTVQIPDN